MKKVVAFIIAGVLLAAIMIGTAIGATAISDGKWQPQIDELHASIVVLEAKLAAQEAEQINETAVYTEVERAVLAYLDDPAICTFFVKEAQVFRSEDYDPAYNRIFYINGLVGEQQEEFILWARYYIDGSSGQSVPKVKVSPRIDPIPDLVYDLLARMTNVEDNLKRAQNDIGALFNSLGDKARAIQQIYARINELEGELK